VNNYLAYAEQVITEPAKRRMRSAETRAANRAQRAQEKALQERDDLLALWKKHHKAQHDALFAGPHGTEAGKLVAFLESMTLDDGADLVDMVVAGSLNSADADTRFTVLQIIDNAIVRLREREGFPPIDDALPNEPDTTFQVIREVLAP
jgi:hypothetical protein